MSAQTAPSPRIARTVAEAAVGDLLWICLDRWRAGEWVLWPVRKVGRTYLSVGEGAHEGLWVRVERSRPNDPNRTVMGAHERTLGHWRGQADEIARRVRACDDVETLKTVGWALGIEAPPDFAAVPPEWVR